MKLNWLKNYFSLWYRNTIDAKRQRLSELIALFDRSIYTRQTDRRLVDDKDAATRNRDSCCLCVYSYSCVCTDDQVHVTHQVENISFQVIRKNRQRESIRISQY